MTNKNISQFTQKASDYGLQEFMEKMGELSQESTKKRLPSRQQIELITLALALYKNYQRCIDIHSSEATKLNATNLQFCHVKQVIFFMLAAPHGDSNLWDNRVINWKDYSGCAGITISMGFGY